MQLLIREAMNMAYLLITLCSHRQHQLMMPKNHQWATQPLCAHDSTCTTKREDLTESTDVVPAKDSLKVKLENFSQL